MAKKVVSKKKTISKKVNESKKPEEKGTKKQSPNKKASYSKALVSFTLAISGFFLIIFSNPAISLVFFTVGLIFSIYAKKEKKTRLAKKSLILNSIGIALSIIWWALLVKLILPYLMQNLQI